jgi:hypothetical protein
MLFLTPDNDFAGKDQTITSDEIKETTANMWESWFFHVHHLCSLGKKKREICLAPNAVLYIDTPSIFFVLLYNSFTLKIIFFSMIFCLQNDYKLYKRIQLYTKSSISKLKRSKGFSFTSLKAKASITVSIHLNQ